MIEALKFYLSLASICDPPKIISAPTGLPIINYRDKIGIGIICIGLAFCFYGLCLRTLPVLRGPASETMPTFANEATRAQALIHVTESALVNDVTFAGVKRWASGDLQRTYTIDESGTKVDVTGKKADTACPT